MVRYQHQWGGRQTHRLNCSIGGTVMYRKSKKQYRKSEIPLRNSLYLKLCRIVSRIDANSWQVSSISVLD